MLDTFDFSSTKETIGNSSENSTRIESTLESTLPLDESDEYMFESVLEPKNKIVDIPGYIISKEIARGGMSTIYLAKRIEDNKEIVLKLMFTEEQEDTKALKRFMREYALISCLDHQNVIRIYERGFGYNFAYIAMEYFPEGDLSRKIESGLPPEICLNYLTQILKGLSAIHELDIVHRDLKPGNILFRDYDNLTITDFGAAKSLCKDKHDDSMDNSILGTPYYMSPEQATGYLIDLRSDIYSIGIIFYQMLTGNKPYRAKTISQLIGYHLKAPIPRLRGNLTRYQPMLDGLLAKDPDERFQSANDVLIAIDWI